jgi:hypothetical protein
MSSLPWFPPGCCTPYPLTPLRLCTQSLPGAGTIVSSASRSECLASLSHLIVLLAISVLPYLSHIHTHTLTHGRSTVFNTICTTFHATHNLTFQHLNTNHREQGIVQQSQPQHRTTRVELAQTHSLPSGVTNTDYPATGILLSSHCDYRTAAALSSQYHPSP